MMLDGLRRAGLGFLLVTLAGCASAPRPGDLAPRSADEIVVCGERFHMGTPVVLWTDPGGYDAYRVEPRFPEALSADAQANWKVEAHYHSMRRHVPAEDRARLARDGMRVEDLARYVDLFVLHYDACGTSQRCFQVLQDDRHLSVHFLLDVDGTIYQTLDLREKAHHATIANDCSIGVEIAHPGCWPQPLSADMRRWYERDDIGWRMRIPPGIENGVLTPDFVARPARPDIVSGDVHGKTWHQFDYTEAQYRALARLRAGLARVFPRIRLDAPRDGNGAVLTRVMTKTELLAFDGIVGHFHVNEGKQDPGPAMQWDRLLAEARALR